MADGQAQAPSSLATVQKLMNSPLYGAIFFEPDKHIPQLVLEKLLTGLRYLPPNL